VGFFLGGGFPKARGIRGLDLVEKLLDFWGELERRRRRHSDPTHLPGTR